MVTEELNIMAETMARSITVAADTDIVIIVEAMDTIKGTAIILRQDIGSITVMPEESMRLMAGGGIFGTTADGITTSSRDGIEDVAKRLFSSRCSHGHSRLPSLGSTIVRR
jgi:hypothetical protein